jgi:hypothetical protein
MDEQIETIKHLRNKDLILEEIIREQEIVLKLVSGEK